MKLWFAKFKISTTLDAQKSLPPSMQRAVTNSAELRRFADNARELDDALKHPPLPAAPAGLHQDIMRAVRRADRATARPVGFQWPRWIPATALASVLLLGALWFTLHQPDGLPTSAGGHTEPSLAGATAALHESSRMVRTTPVAAMEPLMTELSRVQHDLDSATQHLLASLP